MCQRSRHERIANSLTLSAGQYEQVAEKPKIAAHPARSEANDFILIFSDPHPFRVVLQAKRMKCGWAQNGFLSEALPYRQIVDAPNDQIVGFVQVPGSSRPVYDAHRHHLCVRDGAFAHCAEAGRLSYGSSR